MGQGSTIRVQERLGAAPPRERACLERRPDGRPAGEGVKMRRRGPHHEQVMDLLSTEGLGFQAVASRLGISRERVRQIARANGYQGNTAKGFASHKACAICPICRQEMKQSTKATALGHNACRKAANVVTRGCANCGKPVTMPIGIFRGSLATHTRLGIQGLKLWYCDRRCYGQARGRLNGWGIPRQVLCAGCGVEFTSRGARAKWCNACKPRRSQATDNCTSGAL